MQPQMNLTPMHVTNRTHLLAGQHVHPAAAAPGRQRKVDVAARGVDLDTGQDSQCSTVQYHRAEQSRAE